VIAAAATFLAEHYHTPVMLFALLIGIAMNFLSEQSACVPGIAVSARTLLRWGVALLGLRITVGDIAALGWQPAAMVVLSVGLTIGLSIVGARLMGFRTGFGVLSGGATAICGGSAALALAAAMPAHPLKDRALSFTLIGISTLSNIALIVYPVIARMLDLSPTHAGIFLGGTIHDGAGRWRRLQHVDLGGRHGDGRQADARGDAAAGHRADGGADELARIEGRRGAPPLLPWFIVVFAALVLANSMGWIPQPIVKAGVSLSGWCLVVAIAAVGVKTQVKDLVTVGIKPVILMVGETVLLIAIVLGLLRFYG
jgi:uncharacterized membrane protein YadS